MVFSPNTPFALALRCHHATAKSLGSHVLQVQSLVELRRIVSLLRTSETLLREKLVTGSSAERGRSLDTRSTKSGSSCMVSFLTGSCEKMRFISFTQSSKGPSSSTSPKNWVCVVVGRIFSFLTFEHAPDLKFCAYCATRVEVSQNWYF